MAGYIGSKAAVVTPGAERIKTYAITSTTTVLTGLVYSPGFVHVFHNGVRLTNTTDYTATDGSTITLLTAAQNGDEVVVVSYATFQIADTVSASAGGTFQNAVSFFAGSASIPGISVTGDTNTGLFSPAADTVAVATGGTERVRVDSAGNLGLGVTPSAWTRKALQIGDAAAAYVANGSGGATVIATNMFFDGANKYATTAAAARYSVGSGNHEWYIAPSGTAGNAITFTQAMTLDASGHLYPDTTAQTLGTSAKRWGTVFATSLSDGADQLVGSSGTTARLGYGSGWTTLAFATGGTERARIDSSGNLLVGTTTAQSSSANRGNITVGGSAGSIVNWASASSRLGYIFHDGTNMQINNNTGGYLNFYTSDIERARIDASGLFLVGTASGFDNVSSLIAQFLGGVATKINSTASTSQMSFFNPNGRVGFISTSGSATTYSTSSDYRLKENVTPMQNALDTVSQLNPVTYTWKADGSAGQGFIAHELQAVVPDCVTGAKDAVDAEGNPQYQGVDTSFLVATLVKAIQELTARVAELEAN